MTPREQVELCSSAVDLLNKVHYCTSYGDKLSIIRVALAAYYAKGIKADKDLTRE